MLHTTITEEKELHTRDIDRYAIRFHVPHLISTPENYKFDFSQTHTHIHNGSAEKNERMWVSCVQFYVCVRVTMGYF